MSQKTPTKKDKMFPITTSLSYEDIENEGYDISSLTDETMEEIADDMTEALCNNFFETLDTVLEKYNIPMKK